MIRKFEEPGDLLGRKPSTRCEHNVVVRDLAFKVVANDLGTTAMWMEADQFTLYKAHADTFEFRSQVKGYVARFALAECKLHKGRIKSKLWFWRDQCDLVCSANELRETFGGHQPSKAATENQNVRHII